MEKPSEQIRTYWDGQAEELGLDPNCTLPDYNLRRLEAGLISKHLTPSDVVLDIGCGTGTTTVLYAERARRVIGGDFSPKMVERAQECHPRENIEYRVLDVTSIDLPDAYVDVAVTERCLINLTDWQAQQGALREIARVLKPGGRYLMCESFDEPFERFSALRVQFGLEPMKRHWHNRLLRRSEVDAYLPSLFSVEATESLGIYYLVSRLVHPLLAEPEQPRFDAPINAVALRLAMEMDPTHLADISVNTLYVLRKI